MDRGGGASGNRSDRVDDRLVPWIRMTNAGDDVDRTGLDPGICDQDRQLPVRSDRTGRLAPGIENRLFVSDHCIVDPGRRAMIDLFNFERELRYFLLVRRQFESLRKCADDCDGNRRAGA